MLAFLYYLPRIIPLLTNVNDVFEQFDNLHMASNFWRVLYTQAKTDCKIRINKLPLVVQESPLPVAYNTPSVGYCRYVLQ